MRFPRHLRLLFVLPGLTTVGCESSGGAIDTGGPSGPALVALDSVLLIEADTLYIGNPYTPAIDPNDGSFYIPDIFSKRVLRFARSGILIQTYGRPGDGPGEFRGTEVAFVLDDTTFVVHDSGLRRFNYFDRVSGDFRKSTEMPFVLGTTPPVVWDGFIWLPIGDPAQQVFNSVARYDPIRASYTVLGPMPAEYAESIKGGYWSYANHLLRGSLIRNGNALIRGWQGRNELVVLGLDGSVLDTLDIPIVRRRGVPPNVRDLFDVERLDLRERMERTSRLRQLHTLPDGTIGFTHHDQTVITLTPTPVLAASVWVGIISADLKYACVDSPLEVSRDTRSMEVFRGDTLFQLDRRIAEGDLLETWIRMYRIDPRPCDWIPIH